MSNNQEHEFSCDTSLALGLAGHTCRPMIGHHRQQGPSISNRSALDPSLTLGLPDDTYQSSPVKSDPNNNMASAEAASNLVRQSSSHSTVSSFSKVGGEEADRVSSRASEEEEEGSARKKLRLTKVQSALLEDRFLEHSTLTPKQKQALAKQLNLRPRQVEVWFQNRRARTKMKQTEVDCDLLRRCCETLTDENRRLQKELRELRLLKMSSPTPWYMQFPGANLIVCPSCERTRAGDGFKGSPFVAAPKAQLFNPFAR